MKSVRQALGTLIQSNTVLVLFASISMLFLFSNAHAQTYKWVDANGKIVYSDMPPPKNAKKLTSKTQSEPALVSNVKFPAELAAAVAKNPVVLYWAPACDVCDEARSMLKKNGIPFAEKTIKTTADLEKLKEIGGGMQLPLLLISQSKIGGFEVEVWRKALSSAGYPEESMLPKDYRYPDPQAAAPLPPPIKKEDKEKPPEVVKPRTTSPTGIRF